ncbi:MAG: hypothetical protein WCR42_07085 [bacterium]
MNFLKKHYKKLLLICLICLTLVFLYFFLRFGMLLTHAPYASVESYEFNIGSDELESEIEIFKQNNPNLNPPADDPIFGSSAYDSTQEYDYYLPIYFYYPENQIILLTLLMEGDRNHSALGFYSIINPKENSRINDKEINFSLGCSDNIKQKKLFEERIVNPLHKQIREKYKRLKQKK